MLQMLVEKYLVQSETVYGTSIVVKKHYGSSHTKVQQQSQQSMPCGCDLQLRPSASNATLQVFKINS